jgi:outer membrane protein TolC
MESEPKTGPQNEQPSLPEPAQHVASAYQSLKALSEKLSLAQHPELQEAINKLEMALAQLNINTGGMF